jgi:hypothetical protein
MVQDLLAVQAGQASRKHITTVKSVTIPARRFKRWAKIIRIRVSQTIQQAHTSSDQSKMPHDVKKKKKLNTCHNQCSLHYKNGGMTVKERHKSDQNNKIATSAIFSRNRGKLRALNLVRSMY